jgi:type IX secretion system PorP/SprF family membrane protein
MVLKHLSIIVIFVLLTAPLSAQQDPQFTQYMFNNLYFNPAYSGVEGATKVSSFIRSQWTGYQPTLYGGGAPNTQMVSFTAPIFKIHSGFGGYVLHDNLGAQRNIEAQASYAYHLRLKNSKLSFGIRAGIYSQTIDSDLLRFIDQDDPSLPPENTGRYSELKPDLAAGVFLQKEKFYIGAGFSHLIESKFDFGFKQNNRLETHTYITGGYFYEVNFDLRFQFVTLVKSDFVKTQYDIGAIAYHKDTMWGGLSFRQSEAASVLLGWSFLKDKSLRAGYSMDVIVRDRAAKEPLSHELMVSYELPVSPGVGKKAIRTPRYRK